MPTTELRQVLVRPSLVERLRSRRVRRWLVVCVALAGGAVAVWEMQSSTLQSLPLKWSANAQRFTVAEGPSPAIRYPQPGPFDDRLGYSRLPQMLPRLQGERFEIERQARMSPAMLQLTEFGIFPIYKEKSQAGLTILACDGKPLVEYLYPQRAFGTFDTVPPLVVQSLLYIENRELLDARYPHRNPAIEWDRLGFAMIQRIVHTVLPGRTPGGSTLATQIEKYRHSLGGRTLSAGDKLRQMTSASLRAYLDGDDTLPVRQQIVVDYLNTMPLGAPPGVGEVFGIGDGLRGWYGADLEEVSRLLQSTPHSLEEMEAKAVAYRQVLSLLIAQRRPTGLLADPPRLRALTDSHLRLLNKQGVIDDALLRAALDAQVEPGVPARNVITEAADGQKAADAIRTRLSTLLKIDRLYDVDRLDLLVETPMQGTLQREISRRLKALSQVEAAEAAGLMGERLLSPEALGNVVYSFILMERTESGNVVRVQADSTERPFDVNDQAKLDLGSTAKLRTLITYLDIIADLHERFARLDAEALRWVRVSPHDPLSQWALDYLAHAKDRSVHAMLEAAMDRQYSANPGEAFFTGGGVHHFENFHHEDDHKTVTLRLAFHESINLPFIRLMRDIVQHEMFGNGAAGWLEAVEQKERQAYLTRFADREGETFLRRFYQKYRKLDPDGMLDALAKEAGLSPTRLTVALLTVAPDAGPEALREYLQAHLPPDTPFDADALHAKYAPERFTLSDRGALARVHPLELWLVEYLRREPGARFSDVLEASRNVRQEVYGWLFARHDSAAQDIRIRSVREADAFAVIHRQWRRLGFPFESLVPSYATAVGASADRPAALAELVGILANDGVRMPVRRIGSLHFGAGTPFETRLVPAAATQQRVLRPEVAATARGALLGVVQHGTAHRLGSTLQLTDGTKLEIGGKTGTGDNRFQVFAPGGQLVSSRTVSRAGTFAFMIGQRYFGTITAYVMGEEAERYRFTSALPVQLLKALKPVLAQHLSNACVPAPGQTYLTRKSTLRTPQKVAAATAAPSEAVR